MDPKVRTDDEADLKVAAAPPVRLLLHAAVFNHTQQQGLFPSVVLL